MLYLDLIPIQSLVEPVRIELDDPLRARQVLSQLSYGPIRSIVLLIWWVWVDLNHRPHPYQGCALTN